MPSFVPAVYPVPNRYIDVAKEPTPGSIVAATYTFPMTTFKPVDKYERYEDTAWRNAMARLYNIIDGTRIADVSVGGPLFADGIGYVLANILGDYYQFVNGTPGTSTSLQTSVAIGATQITLAGANGAIGIGTIISIGATATTAEEVRKVTNVTSGTILTLNAALYQAHGSGGTVIAWPTVTNIGHVFSLLNAGVGAGGWTASQPPTYSYYDFTGVPASQGGSGARIYSYTCFSEVTITGEATGLVMWDGKITALASSVAQSAPPVTLSSVKPQPSWDSTVAFNGQGTINNAEWKLTLTRKVDSKFANSGQQDPVAIPRGYGESALSFNFDPASDELEFGYYLNNTQPSAQIVASNGLSGTNASSLTINSQIAAFDTGELNDSKDTFGFDETVKCVASTTNAGPSGGYSPISITLVNGVVNY